MEGNLIHNYINNSDNTQKNYRQQGGGHFRLPTVSSTIESFDKETDKLITPLDGKGHLINGDLVHMPKEAARDTVYMVKSFADGVRGKGNDHQLGKMNDLGLGIGGLSIAAYLMTKKSTPKTKAMEFIGFGTFLASMALWPKIALEIPARIIHGFNFRKQYIDDQGRKKFVSQDPNYIPFDLYKGDKDSENLDVIGDRLGISRDIPNRHQAIQDQMRKISVQNNTLWMLTAGIANPIMTALACSGIEKAITPMLENYGNKKANVSIDKLDSYLNGQLNSEQKQQYETKVLKLGSGNPKTDKLTLTVNRLKGKNINEDELTALADTLADGFDSEMKNAAKADIIEAMGGKRYIANSNSAERLSNRISGAISAKDTALAEKITPDKIKKAASEGIIRGAVRDLLTAVGFDAVDNAEGLEQSLKQRVSTNFKCKDVEGIEFLKETAETRGMTPAERLAYNIKSIVLKVNNDRPQEDFIPGMTDLERQNKYAKAQIDAKLKEGADDIARRFYGGELAISGDRENYVRRSVSRLYKEEAPRGPRYSKIFSSIDEIITDETSSNHGYMFSDEAAVKVQNAGKRLKKYRAIDGVLSANEHFKVEKASETVVANNWAKVNDVLIKELGISGKETSLASKSKALSYDLLTEKLEKACSNEESYKKLITSLAQSMSELDEKLDAPEKDGSGRMMDKIENGIRKNCTDAGDALGELNMTEMKKKMVSSRCGKLGVNTGSILDSRLSRLHSRVEGVQSSYMRLIQTCEFFRRSSEYEKELAEGKTDMEVLARKYGFTTNVETNKELIKRGKELLLDAHTDKFYNKMGTLNNPNFYKTLMWSVYRPNHSGEWDKEWNKTTERTIEILDGVKINGETPRRVFDGRERVSLGQKLKEHMNMMYNSFGSIERKILERGEPLRAAGAGIDANNARAAKRFDLLGKTPSDFLYDTLKQKSNTRKWMRMFAPILGATFGVSVLAQFFFGKKDPDIKA